MHRKLRIQNTTGSIKLETHYFFFCKSNWYESQHADKSQNRKKPKGLGGEEEK